MENINAATDPRTASRNAYLAEENFQETHLQWEIANTRNNVPYEYGTGQKARKTWPAELLAAYEAMNAAKAAKKTAVAEARAAREARAAERKATKQAERAVREGECQICGRPILCTTGVIAHHGYTRPWEGFQTSSCPGARELPYAESCDFLRSYIPTLAGAAAVAKAAAARFLENPPETITVSRKSSFTGKTEATTYERPKGFKVTDYSSIPRTYANAYANRLGNMQQEAKGLAQYVEFLRARLAAWTPKK